MVNHPDNPYQKDQSIKMKLGTREFDFTIRDVSGEHLIIKNRDIGSIQIRYDDQRIVKG